MLILCYVLMGVTAGMRTLTAIAVLSWFAWLGLLPQTGWAFWVGSVISVGVFTLCALGEYVGDTLPRTPNRTAPLPLTARLVFGALVGGLAARGITEPAAGGAIFGVLGALAGAYGGYRLRMGGARFVRRDRPVALAESAVALSVAVAVCWKFHEIALQVGRYR